MKMTLPTGCSGEGGHDSSIRLGSPEGRGCTVLSDGAPEGRALSPAWCWDQNRCLLVVSRHPSFPTKDRSCLRDGLSPGREVENGGWGAGQGGCFEKGTKNSVVPVPSLPLPEGPGWVISRETASSFLRPAHL